MFAQRVHRVVLLLAVGLASCGVHCRVFRPGRDVPPRCLEASVTPVSCAGTHILDNLLPHPDDCELFYYCVSPVSRPICRQCPAHLHFNPRLRVCDQPAVAGCRAPGPAPPTDEPSTAATTAEEDSYGTTNADVTETATTGGIWDSTTNDGLTEEPDITTTVNA